MGIITDRAQAREHVRTLDTDWNWRIQIGGAGPTGISISRALTANVGYPEDGAASLELETDTDLSGMERATVEVYCGYGRHQVRYFVGILDDPIRDPFTGLTHALAYGVQGAMARQYFDTPRDYSFVRLQQFFAEVNDLLYDPRAVITVKEAFEVFLAEDVIFGGEVSLAEAASSVLEPTGMVMLDRPDYDLLVMPTPQPAIGGGVKASYDRRHYASGAGEGASGEEGLSIVPASEGPFYKVVVFRRDEEGGEGIPLDVVRAERRINNPGPYFPKPNEILWVPEFPGSQDAAEKVAYLTAQSAATGSRTGTLPTSANPELLPADSIRVSRREDSIGKMYEASYICSLTSTNIDLVAGRMEMAFAALPERRELVQRTAVVVSPRRSGHVMDTATQAKAVQLDAAGGRYYLDTEALAESSMNQWFGVDEGDSGEWWIDPDLAPPDVAGYDEVTGEVWVDLEVGATYRR